MESKEVAEKKLAEIDFENANEDSETKTAAVKDFEKPKFPKKSMDKDSSEGQDWWMAIRKCKSSGGSC